MNKITVKLKYLTATFFGNELFIENNINYFSNIYFL